MRSLIKNPILLLFIFCCPFTTKAQGNINIIPWPQQVVDGKGYFTFNNTTSVVYERQNKALGIAVSPLLKKLKAATDIKMKTGSKAGAVNNITVKLTDKIKEEEGYALSVTPGGINISAKTPVGVFYAIQSLLQLLPVEIESNTLVKGVGWKVPVVEIKDAPSFSYRGLMLDVARHYMQYEFIEKLIDLMAMQKMNTLHLH